jgi:hypothetical protein
MTPGGGYRGVIRFILTVTIIHGLTTIPHPGVFHHFHPTPPKT